MIKKIILWILIVSCMGTVFYFSSQVATESKETSSGLIEKIVKVFDFDNSLDEAAMKEITEDLTFVVRKGAHFSIYALLGLLIILLMYEYRVYGKLALLISVGASMLYACSDEIHQTFVQGRSGEIRDVIIDTFGAFVGCIIVIIYKKIKSNRGKRNGLHENL